MEGDLKYTNLKLKLMWPNQIIKDDLLLKMTPNIKVKYTSNNWLNLPQILNLNLCDQANL
jgi:hypothetical protein